MSDSVIHTLFLLVISFAIFNGILMLVAPSKHRRFLFWFGRANSWSRPIGKEPRRGLEIERRLAGLIMAAMGIYIAWDVVLNAEAGRKKLDVGSTVSSPGVSFFSILIGLCLLVSGLFIIVRPQSVVQWSKLHQSIVAEVPDSTLTNWKTGARFLGVFIVIGAIYTLWAGLK
jgi:uncharacterized protein YjeT (DUF2065 family)